MPDDRKTAIPFERLEVFQRAYRLSLEVHRVSLGFPDIERFALADQVRRGSKSICANLAEGFAKQSLSPAEFRRFVAMALGSADEMRWQAWRDEYQEIAKMLQGLLRGSRRQRAASLSSDI